MNSINECFWFGQVWLGMGSDGEPDVIFIVMNGAVEFLFGVFGYTHAIFSLVLSSFLS